MLESVRTMQTYIKVFLVFSLLTSFMLMPFLSKTFAVIDNFTHAAISETFGWTS